MAVYVIKVKSGKEERALQKLLNEERLLGSFFVVNQKKKQRLKNPASIIAETTYSLKEVEKALFPGYVFYESVEDDNFDSYNPPSIFVDELIYGFLRLDSGLLRPIQKSEELFLQKLKQNNYVLDTLHVRFNEADKIQLLSGPFKDCEVMVTKVDRRKKKLWLDISLLGDVRTLILSYYEVTQWQSPQ